MLPQRKTAVIEFVVYGNTHTELQFVLQGGTDHFPLVETPSIHTHPCPMSQGPCGAGWELQGRPAAASESDFPSALAAKSPPNLQTLWSPNLSITTLDGPSSRANFPRPDRFIHPLHLSHHQCPFSSVFSPILFLLPTTRHDVSFLIPSRTLARAACPSWYVSLGAVVHISLEVAPASLSSPRVFRARHPACLSGPARLMTCAADGASSAQLGREA